MSLILPDYRIVSEIGRGAGSDIYCVENIETGELKAAKHVKLTNEDEKKFVDQLRAEQATAQALDHPVIRKVFDLRFLRKRLRVQSAVLMMEYVDGIDFSSTKLRWTLDELLNYFKDVADGLGAMHQQGFVHADLKPGNLILTRDNKVKLIDLGQSSAIRVAKEKIQGTPDYMAPEQAKRSVLDQRTDVYGLGATLYKILSGGVLQTEMNRTAGIHLEGRIGKRLSDLNRGNTDNIPTCLIRLIEDCRKDDPMERLADMRAVVNRIELTQAILAQEQVHKVEDAAAAARKGEGEGKGKKK
jgi:eukaryotic-like serine/threonine-protein kinase